MGSEGRSHETARHHAISRRATFGVSADAAHHARIGEYAVIGDGRSVALVSIDGSLDWLCWPRFDSPSVFAALLDAESGGRWSIQPAGGFRSTRRYIPDTNILETTFATPGGEVVLRDLMPVVSEAESHAGMFAEHELLREVECLSGEVEVTVHYDPRPDYGRRRAGLVERGAVGVACACGRGMLLLRSEASVSLSADGHTASGTFTLRAGQRCALSLSYSEVAPAVLPQLGAAARERVEQTRQWWRAWAAQCRYDGPYRDAVVRSALALKLMVYAPSGAIIAAPTTSLPEAPGGERNWDYRYCWLRDASFTVRALLGLGYREEAAAYVGWIHHATRLTWPRLQVVYDVFGEANLPERVLPHLAGHGGSRPVRIGNDAHDQVQLDVYGEVIDAIARFLQVDGHVDRSTTRFLDGLGKTVCERWRDADEGIWEGRSGRSHHTHSKVLCWVALDRLVALHESHGLALDVGRFRTERAAIHAEIERSGYNEWLRSYTRLLDGDDLDAALLTLPLYGYIDAAQPRMQSTLARIKERLGVNGFLYRYARSTRDGLPAGEGAFGVCGFWAVECRALAGDVAGARQAFERLLLSANDVGLFAEESDPVTGEPLGNFPQAFTHVGVINAALTLTRSSVAPGAESGANPHPASSDEERAR